jgi:hypothetical protein
MPKTTEFAMIFSFFGLELHSILPHVEIYVAAKHADRQTELHWQRVLL